MGKVVLIINCFFLSFCLYSQKDKVVLSIEPSSAEIGGTLTITVESTVQGEFEVENLPSSFVHGYAVMNGMSEKMDFNTGKVVRLYYYSQTGAIQTPGKYTIGPAWIKAGGKSYKSNTVVVNIVKKPQMHNSDVSSKQLNDPAFGIIQVNKKSIYEGEPLIVSAKVFARFEPDHLNSYKGYDIDGALEHYSLGNNKSIQIDEEVYKGIRFNSFEYDKQVVFPVGSGQVKIEPFAMTLFRGFDRFPLTSGSALINIKALPPNPPADFIGGVGVFEITRIINAKELNNGDVFKMTVQISGTGNLQNILEPSLNLPKGFLVYGDPVISEQFNFGAHGADGRISYEYNIQVSSAIIDELPAVTISYFDPDLHQYVQKSSDKAKLKINGPINADAATTRNEIQPENESSSQLRNSDEFADSYSFYSSFWYWSSVGAPLLAGMFMLFFVRRKINGSEKTERKQQIKKDSDELLEYVKHAELLASEIENDQFFAHVEKALKKACEVSMSNPNDVNLTKQEIFNFLESENQNELKNKIEEIFSTCEQSRFGLLNSEKSKHQLILDLKNVISALKA